MQRRSVRSGTKRQRTEKTEDEDETPAVNGDKDSLVAELRKLRQDLMEQMAINSRLTGELKEQMRKVRMNQHRE